MSAPDPQNHPLDAALRAQAERRRAELPPVGEMPGPMRAALQREVARQHAPPVTGRRESWLDKLFRWQSLFATAATAVLTIGLFAWSQGWWAQPRRLPMPETAAAPAPPPAGGEVALAKRKETPAALDAPAPAFVEKRLQEATEKKQDSSPAGAGPADLADERRRRDGVDADALKTETTKPAVTRDELAGTRDRGPAKREVEDKLAVAPPAPVAQPAPPLARRLEPAAPAKPIEQSGSGRIVGGVTAAPVLSAPAAAAKAAETKTATTAIPAKVQRFVQAPGQQATRQLQQRAIGPASTVLTDFTVRQTGNAIVLTDRDGSEFRGEVLTAEAQNSRRALTQNALVNRAAKDASQMNGSYAFRVTGVSKTLGQSVVIEAEVETEPAAPMISSNASGGKPAGTSTQSSQDQMGYNASPNTKYRQEARQDLGLNNAAPTSDRRLRFYGEVRGERDVVEVEAVGE